MSTANDGGGATSGSQALMCRASAVEPGRGDQQSGVSRCPNAGHEVRLACPQGRPEAVGGPYCDVHGGRARAEKEAARSWNYLAPAEVGDAKAVVTAGMMVLNTQHAYVVLRPEGDHWLAWIGLGTHMIAVRDPSRLTARERRAIARWGAEGLARERKLRPEGSGAFPTRENALTRAIEVWRTELEKRIAQIRSARGGTLDWGDPVEPLQAPVVVDLGEQGSSWSAVAAQMGSGPGGPTTFLGLTPSGELPLVPIVTKP